MIILIPTNVKEGGNLQMNLHYRICLGITPKLPRSIRKIRKRKNEKSKALSPENITTRNLYHISCRIASERLPNTTTPNTTLAPLEPKFIVTPLTCNVPSICSILHHRYVFMFFLYDIQ